MPPHRVALHSGRTKLGSVAGNGAVGAASHPPGVTLEQISVLPRFEDGSCNGNRSEQQTGETGQPSVGSARPGEAHPSVPLTSP